MKLTAATNWVCSIESALPGKRNWLFLGLLSVLLPVLVTLAGCSKSSVHAESNQSSALTVKAVSSPPPEDGQWVMPAKDYGSTRYSQLTGINTSNAKDLKLAWTFSTGTLHGHEAAPLIVGDTMYLTTPYPNVLYALDLTKGGTVKWASEAGEVQGIGRRETVFAIYHLEERSCNNWSDIKGYIISHV